MKKYRLAFIIVILLLAIFMMVVPAYATELPDSNPTVEEINVYRNLLETGDWLILIYHNIPYATTPDEPIWQTFMWRLFSADNTTEIATILPYSFNENGYGYSVSSMYFAASDVTASNITWGDELILKLSGNPVNFASPPQYNYTISDADYTTLSDSTDVQAELAARILALCSELDTRWALGSAYSLIQETETGTVLSVYGEAFFREVIYGLQGLCPEVFAYVISDYDLTQRDWDEAYVTTLQDLYTGTWVDTARNSLDALFGTDYSIVWLMISVLFAAVVLILDIMATGEPWLGVMDASAVLIITTRLGIFSLGYLGLLAALCVMYGAARLWGVFK